jgi:hypothetical protein
MGSAIFMIFWSTFWIWGIGGLLWFSCDGGTFFCNAKSIPSKFLIIFLSGPLVLVVSPIAITIANTKPIWKEFSLEKIINAIDTKFGK